MLTQQEGTFQEQLVSLNETLENPEVNKMLALENPLKVISIDPQNPPISQLKYVSGFSFNPHQSRLSRD
jgi:hypothetical protein